MKISRKELPSKTGAAFIVLILSATFVRLGFWQLDRAAEFRELQRPYIEKPVIDLEQVATPGQNLGDSAINRIVSLSGEYLRQYTAANQEDKHGVKSDWTVGLLEVGSGGAILVVRSVSSSEIPVGRVEITGRLFNRQFDDRGDKSSSRLSRIDPALLAASYDQKFFDGFVLARDESIDGVEIRINPPELDPAKPNVPGYYWQHISYVAIWWLMALVVLFLPFYQAARRRQE
ncbi:MAG: SURF1 family protein [Actinobacteria bacterium]|nr:SURF1 family protein [Actinomycetota bacterium]